VADVCASQSASVPLGVKVWYSDFFLVSCAVVERKTRKAASKIEAPTVPSFKRLWAAAIIMTARAREQAGIMDGVSYRTTTTTATAIDDNVLVSIERALRLNDLDGSVEEGDRVVDLRDVHVVEAGVQAILADVEHRVRSKVVLHRALLRRVDDKLINTDRVLQHYHQHQHRASRQASEKSAPVCERRAGKLEEAARTFSME